jgi:1-phosphofructokinase family hexose kinase
MIYTVTLNPTIDHTLTVEGFHVGGTFKASQGDHLPAGKGINVARVVATLGCPVVALGLVGENDAPTFAAALAAAGIEDRLIPIPGPTRSSVTVLDPARGTETHLREPGRPLPENALSQMETQLAALASGDWVVLAGSLPPGTPAQTYETLIRLCARRGVRTVLDANGPALLSGVRADPTLLKPNLFELWQVDHDLAESGVERDLRGLPEAEVLSMARRVQARGTEMVIVSLGQRGALGLDSHGRAWRAQAALDRPIVNAVGSGDALVAGLTVALARGDAFPEVLRLGVACGTANTLVAGAGRCRRADIERLAEQAEVVPPC